MRMKVALCQMCPVPGEPELNAETIVRVMGSDDSQILIFPESFLTGYGISSDDVLDRVDACIDMLSKACRDYDRAIAVGTARRTSDGIMNTLAFLSPDGDTFYDKLHLARFGIYSEEEFTAGNGPVMGSYHGMGFGLSICYDVYFPEIMHSSSLNGACVNICVSAAARPSKRYFDRILPARALENVSYLAFVNNTGLVAGLEMAGSTRALDPFGDTLTMCGEEEGIIHFDMDPETLRKCRETRRHLMDFRRDIDWSMESF